jgi:hypothetical protein
MTDTPNPIHRYLCGGVYVVAGLAMATSGATGLYGNQPGALLELPGGLVVAVLGSAVIRECRRQSHLDATVGNRLPAVGHPTATIRRPASSRRGVGRASRTQPDVACRPA